MDKNNRPLGREKNITSGSSNVHLRGDGLHASGPAGNKEGYQGKEGTGAGGSGVHRDVYAGGGSGRRLNPIAIIIALVIMLGGGGTGLASMFGGGSTGVPSGSILTDNYNGGFSNSTSNTISTTDQSMTNGGTTVIDTSVAPEAREKRTVMKGDGSDIVTILVYMCGTDLESRSGMASSDLQEMINASLSEQVNLIVYTGGCRQWKNNMVSNRTNQIYQVTKGNIKCLKEDIGSKSMTDPNTLSDFIRWGTEKFPANRYDLILWDHGGGSISGYGYDEVYANSGSMTIDKIGQALKNGGTKFDFVGFDACLMATLETALAVEPYADYLIASEETEPGVGWYYTNWLTSLSNNTSMPTVEIGKAIIDDFVSVCGQKVPNSQTTLSITDLAELHGTVPETFKAFAQSTTELIQKDQYQVVSNARSSCKEFSKKSHIDQVDLIHLAQKMNTKESLALVAVLDSAVKYNRTSRNIQNANGIAIYFPYGRVSTVNKMAATYEKIGLDDAYTKCIKSFASVEAAGQTVAGGTSGEMTSLFGSLMSAGAGYSSESTVIPGAEVANLLNALLSARSMPELGVEEADAGFVDEDTIHETQDFIAKNQFDVANLVWSEKDGEHVLILKEDQWDLLQTIELNVFVDNGSGYIDLGLDNVYEFTEDGDLIGDYDHTWLAINGQIVAYYLLSVEGDASDYTIVGRVPARLNDQPVDLMVQFTDEKPNGFVTGAAIVYDEETETATQAKGLIDLENGDVIDFVCDFYDYEQNYVDSYYLGDALTVNGELVVSNIEMDNTDYIAAFRLTDIYNNHYWTPSIPE